MAFWCQDYLDCDGVLVDGVTVDSRANDRNNDGIDIDGCRDVFIADGLINFEDMTVRYEIFRIG